MRLSNQILAPTSQKNRRTNGGFFVCALGFFRVNALLFFFGLVSRSARVATA